VASYKVKGGDSLITIAKRKGISYGALVAANPQISDPNKIYSGQTIRLPSQKQAASMSQAQIQAGVNKVFYDEAGTRRDSAQSAQVPKISTPSVPKLGETTGLMGMPPGIAEQLMNRGVSASSQASSAAPGELGKSGYFGMPQDIVSKIREREYEKYLTPKTTYQEAYEKGRTKGGIYKRQPGSLSMTEPRVKTPSNYAEKTPGEKMRQEYGQLLYDSGAWNKEGWVKGTRKRLADEFNNFMQSAQTGAWADEVTPYVAWRSGLKDQDMIALGYAKGPDGHWYKLADTYAGGGGGGGGYGGGGYSGGGYGGGGYGSAYPGGGYIRGGIGLTQWRTLS